VLNVNRAAALYWSSANALKSRVLNFRRDLENTLLLDLNSHLRNQKKDAFDREE
jgi:hypothetical protein